MSKEYDEVPIDDIEGHTPLQHARTQWQEAQDKLAAIQTRLNEITNNECGIEDNLAQLARERRALRQVQITIGRDEFMTHLPIEATPLLVKKLQRDRDIHKLRAKILYIMRQQAMLGHELVEIIARDGCLNTTSGDCYSSGRIEGGHETASSVCFPCIAKKAMLTIGALPFAKPDSNVGTEPA